jgi:magnesium transporter
LPSAKRRSRPGSAPGSLITDPAADRSEIHYFRYDSDRIEEQRDCAAGELPPATDSDAAVLWVDVVGLADADLIQSIGTRFGLHHLALEDVVNVHQRPKVEEYDGHLYIVLRMATPGSSSDTEQVSIFLSKTVVITFQERAGDCFDPVRQRIRQGKGRIRGKPADYLVYALIDATVDGYFPVLDAGGEALAALEDEVVIGPRPEHIEHIHSLKRNLLALRRATWPTRDLLSALLRDEFDLVSDATRVYLRDVHDHTVQLIDIIETYREIASGLVDAYLSSQSTRLNEVMKFLTILSTVFLPLTFVTGLYGMNFDTASPWNMPELGWRFGYPFALLIMAGAAVGLLYLFWRRGWIRR